VFLFFLINFVGLYFILNTNFYEEVVSCYLYHIGYGFGLFYIAELCRWKAW